ncbi:MAG: hypothetical protein ACKV2T_07080 [Kofleriaceae bacterium]
MHVRTLFLTMILVAACGTKDGGGEGDKTTKKKSDRPTNKDVTSLFTGTTVTLPPEVAKAAFDTKKAEVEKALGEDSGYMSSKTHADVSYDLQYTRAENLEKITVTTRGTKLEPILTKQWGPAVKLEKGAMFWFNPEAGVRAWIPERGDGERVTFSKYEAPQVLLGGKGFDLAMAKDKPLFGATLDELHAAWGAKLCDWERESATLKKAYEENAKDSLYRLENSNLKLRLCPAWSRTIEEYSPNSDTVYMGRDGRVFAIGLSFPTGGSTEISAQLVKVFDGKFGTATEVKDGDSTERFYFDPAAKMRAIARVGKDYMNLMVGPYIPVAELIGDASKPGFAIETPSMVGGTVEQISKENEKTIHHMGTLHELVYPPTEWTVWQTEVDLRWMAKETKSDGYRIVVHHTNHEPGGDAVFELLKAKYGEPKKTEDVDKGKMYTFAKGGRTLRAWRVSQQWQLNVTK